MLLGLYTKLNKVIARVVYSDMYLLAIYLVVSSISSHIGFITLNFQKDIFVDAIKLDVSRNMQCVAHRQVV